MLGGQLLGIGSRRRRCNLGDACVEIIFKLHGSPLSSTWGCIARSHVRLRRASSGGGSRRGTTSVASAQISETAGPHARNRARPKTSVLRPVRNRAGIGRRGARGRRIVPGSAARSRRFGRGEVVPGSEARRG